MNAELSYEHDGVNCRAYCSFPENIEKPSPLVLIAHDWSGRNTFACQKADELAALGYVGCAMDLYGDARVGKTNDEKSKLMQPLMQDRLYLQQRVKKAITAACTLPEVDSNKIAAIGFCFGGLVVLDLARSGGNILGVVSFHGLLIPPPEAFNQKIRASILMLHGDVDPMVKPEAVRLYVDELTHMQADWQIHVYGNTMHAFTNPQANDPNFGTVFNPVACKRAMQAMKLFLKEKL